MNFLSLIGARLVSFFIDKKRIIGWVSAAAMAVIAAAAGMHSDEVKSAVCGTPPPAQVEQGK